MIYPTKTVRYEVEITSEGDITCTACQRAEEPFNGSMTSEIVSAIESAIQGGCIGGYELIEDGCWIKPLGSTHKDGGVISYRD